MELKEFVNEFLENALINVEEENSSLEDEITTDILDYVIDSGDIIAAELCHFKIRGIKINAWNYDEENSSIDLLITIIKNEPRLTKVSDKEIIDAFTKAENFFWSAREGTLLSKVDEADIVVFDLVQIIEQTKNSVDNLRIFVFTNGQASADIAPDAVEKEGIFIDYQLWDIERIHQQYLIRLGKQKIEIDFLNDYNYRLNCLRLENGSENIDAYLAIIPGKILAKIYDKYRQGLLEKNVRTFLQFKAKVNQGIRETIRKEPDMFFAYNNGISTTAEKVEVEYESNVPYITHIDNWQIVNGGQTTASIYATSNEKERSLSEVYVQMKITIVKNRDEMEIIVPKISRFANSQTAIKDSDFSSNSPYHITLENFSRSEWVPTNTGGRATNKWFYERTRGQYLDEKSKRTKPEELRRFDREYPKKQKFTKTDLAKYEMSWWQRPYDVSKGGENNFKIFTKELANEKNEVSKKYYQRLVAKAILFKEIDRIVAKENLGGYKANMVSYIVALLSYKSNKKLNLDNIWENQSISEPLYNQVLQMISVVWKHINTPSKQGMNIGEWCKKQECWLTLKDKNIDINLSSDEFIKDETYVETDLVGQELTPQEFKIIDEARKIEAEVWFKLSKWAKENNRFTPFDRKLAYNLGILANRKALLTIKQAKSALRILKQAIDEGFVE